MIQVACSVPGSGSARPVLLAVLQAARERGLRTTKLQPVEGVNGYYARFGFKRMHHVPTQHEDLPYMLKNLSNQHNWV